MLAPHVDQATVLLACHHRQHGLRHLKRGLQFVIDPLLEFLPGHLLKGCKPAAHRSVAHQNIKTPVGVDDGSRQPRHLLRVTHVAWIAYAFPEAAWISVTTPS